MRSNRVMPDFAGKACLGCTILFTVVQLMTVTASADTAAFKIHDDDKLSSAVSEVRAEFLKDKPFDRLDATILVKQPDGSWKRGSHNPEVINYPASCVKLAYMAAAMRWSKENSLPYNHLDKHVRPMIEKSDNVETGNVVDAITSAPNIDDLNTTSDPRYADWYEKRRYTEKFLIERGLLENQTILHKTYPTNSGDSPRGAEKVARDDRGANKMQPKCSASLMLEIVYGAIEPDANAYMRELLNHDRWKGNSVLGIGVPPGSEHLNKPGNAYDTVEDICYVKLPNGQEIVVAVFTNGFVRPYTGDPTRMRLNFLGPFMEMLIERLGLDGGNPPKLKIDDKSAGVTTKGDWQTSSAAGQFGDSHLVKSGGTGEASVTWNLSVPEEGLYEVCVWYPQDKTRAKDAEYRVVSSAGESTVSVNQRVAGGRWYLLGDFEFAKGAGAVVLTDRSESTTATIAADAVRAIRWPGGKRL